MAFDTYVQSSKCKMLKSTYLSKVAAKIYLPLGENFTNETGGLSSSKQIKFTTVFHLMLTQSRFGSFKK